VPAQEGRERRRTRGGLALNCAQVSDGDAQFNDCEETRPWIGWC